MSTKITVACDQCGKSIQRRPDRPHPRYFCSRECQQAASRTQVEVPCARCGTVVLRKPSQLAKNNVAYCNKECHDATQTKREPIPCDYCGELVIRHPSQTKHNHVFCNTICRAAFQGKKVDTQCAWCNKALKLWPCHIRERNYCCKECRKEGRSHYYSGENTPTWRGGWKGYYGPNWNRQSRLARKRDNYCCQMCGMKQSDHYRALDVHHITPFRCFNYVVGENDNYLFANDLDNLITLCPKCHGIADREYQHDE